ncbi:type III-A CRISPR-associated protein Csm2 [Rivularia sp. UHCC 0363]|uniref:type III-A CRISPR-associated protein Csm2 n=1 Tax=Rivularia sp. UHCC 0363 TaxID=3110244 RepID=UPI002B20DAA4|nr:type III-A CRISPR-associated protein Csm2 [Rivularia sp. UHCC 0363]MEA5593483.1 type III-A CRISPR-associated protein Csm2 [Rivularia sp. UHCC 0363]
MTQPIKPVNRPVPTSSPKESENRGNSNNRQSNSRNNSNQSTDIVKDIIDKINTLDNKLRDYPIRELVKHAEEFGPYLKGQRLETNQVRKFLDAINRLKAVLADTGNFSKIDTDIVLLKPKLAYAAARQKAAKPLSDVMSVAIDSVHSKEDFERLVQLIESIIAYHKAEGGK